MKALLKVACFSLLLSGVAVLSYSQGRQHERDEAALMRTDRDFARATAANGAAGFASFFATPGNRLEWKPTGAESERDLGCTLGRYQMTQVDEKGGKTIGHGTYITAWRRQPDQSWKVIFDGGVPDPAPEKRP